MLVVRLSGCEFFVNPSVSPAVAKPCWLSGCECDGDNGVDNDDDADADADDADDEGDCGAACMVTEARPPPTTSLSPAGWSYSMYVCMRVHLTDMFINYWNVRLYRKTPSVQCSALTPDFKLEHLTCLHQNLASNVAGALTFLFLEMTRCLPMSVLTMSLHVIGNPFAFRHVGQND